MKQLSTTLTQKTASLLALCLMLMLGVSVDAQAQRTVDVAPGFGTLNVAIDGDTTATGGRTDSSTVYVLQRDGLYLLDGSIEHRDFHLTIVAAEGSGEKPRLVPAVGTGGSSIAFRPRGSLTLRDLYVTNEDEQGGLNNRIIRVSTNDSHIEIDGVHLDKASQSGFRIDGGGNTIIIRNSTISNIGTVESPENGRGVDDRGNQIDTLIIENSTFYNLTSQVFRDDGGLTNFAWFNQNTIYNTGIGTSIELGGVVEGTITNNLIVNATAYGYVNTDTTHVLTVYEMTQDEIDSLGAQSLTVANNNNFLHASVIDVFPDSVSAPELYNSVVSAVETGSTSEDITFTNVPAAPVGVITEYYAGAAGTTSFDVSGEPFDFGYANTFASYTGSTKGDPLGSLIWHGGVTVGLEDDPFAENPTGFKLHGNYPNPFNPTTNISISLPAAADVSVEVFNMIGQKVMSVPTQHFGAGENQLLSVDARSLTSGMYIYRVTATSGAQLMTRTGKMTLIK